MSKKPRKRTRKPCPKCKPDPTTPRAVKVVYQVRSDGSVWADTVNTHTGEAGFLIPAASVDAVREKISRNPNSQSNRLLATLGLGATP